jgi:hypothetical protein
MEKKRLYSVKNTRMKIKESKISSKANTQKIVEKQILLHCFGWKLLIVKGRSLSIILSGRWPLL